MSALMTYEDAKRPYRTIFVCELRQLSSLSVGGTNEGGLTDLPLCRDGKGQLVLRGSALAGALIATARTMLALPSSISRLEHEVSSDNQGLALPPSDWNFWNAHPVSGNGLETTLRSGSGHRHDTRAAGDSMLFDYEVLPPGVSWRFLLDVSHPPQAQDDSNSDVVAALALTEWMRGRCWLGRKVSRGLGWMQLEACTVYALPRTEAAVDAWPTSVPESLEEQYAAVERLAPGISLEAFLARRDGLKRKPALAYVRWSCALDVGAYQPGGNVGATFGLDALSVGTHSAESIDAEDFEAGGDVPGTERPNRHLAIPSEIDWQAFKESFNPDHTIAMVHRNGSWQPFVPGSALAGTFRHWLSRKLRAGDAQIWDPVAGTNYSNVPMGDLDAAELLMGTMRKDLQVGSRLLFSEAYLAADAGAPWNAALLEKVALDEFAQSALSGAKFNRMALLNGCFKWTLIQEVVADQTLDAAAVTRAIDGVQQVFSDAERHHLGLGGGEFRGYGHVAPRIERLEWAPAGEDWRPLDGLRQGAIA